MPSLSSPNSQDPPQKLLVRTARVSKGGDMNTVRVPGDPYADRSKLWLLDDKAPHVTSGNQMKYTIDGPDTFHEMIRAIRTANAPGHFIFLTGWWLDVEFELSRYLVDRGPADDPDAKLNLRSLLSAADKKGVTIRAMVWDQTFGRQNDSDVEFIRSLTHGDAILDERGNEGYETELNKDRSFATSDQIFLFTGAIMGLVPRFYGSQHQKILCVHGEEGLICFCGGVDFNPDRILAQGGGSPLHDMHCRILGPAALDLVNTFLLRWNDHHKGIESNLRHGELNKLVPKDAKAPQNSPHFVRIGRTFGKDPQYGFAMAGERTAADTILNAVSQAKHFIYTEDQYFVGTDDLLAALQQAFKNGIQHLTAVITHWRVSDLPQVVQRRRAFIQKLKAAAGSPDKVRFFALNPLTGPVENVYGFAIPPDSPLAVGSVRATDTRFRDFDRGSLPHTYVHSKLWIVDDEFLSIGSVNCNNRSFTHDTEVLAAQHDASSDEVLTYRLARRARIQLWQEHLGMQGAEGEAQLAYGVASGVHWLSGNRPTDALVREYNEDELSDGRGNRFKPVTETDSGWQTFIDPS